MTPIPLQIRIVDANVTLDPRVQDILLGLLRPALHNVRVSILGIPDISAIIIVILRELIKLLNGKLSTFPLYLVVGTITQCLELGLCIKYGRGGSTSEHQLGSRDVHGTRCIPRVDA